MGNILEVQLLSENAVMPERAFSDNNCTSKIFPMFYNVPFIYLYKFSVSFSYFNKICKTIFFVPLIKFIVFRIIGCYVSRMFINWWHISIDFISLCFELHFVAYAFYETFI